MIIYQINISTTLPTFFLFFIDRANPSVVCNQHSFTYQRGDNFTMSLNAIQIDAPAATDAVAFVTRYTGKLALKSNRSR